MVMKMLSIIRRYPEDENPLHLILDSLEYDDDSEDDEF